MAILTSCQSEHERQVKMMNDLLEATDNYDAMPNDSLARATLYYMERHGKPHELQQAWRMMARMYHRHGSLFYERFAYEMAANSVDSLSNDYDPRAVAEICYEWSVNQQFSFEDMVANQLALQGMSLAQQAGDTTLYYRCMGQQAYVRLLENREEAFLDSARIAYEELWKRGRKDWAVDAFFPYMFYKNDGSIPDSIVQWTQRYEQFTEQDITHVESYAALEYMKLRGDYYLHQNNFDSAHYYYSKLDHPWNYIRYYGYRLLFNLYDKFPDRDPDYKLRNYYNDNAIYNYFDVKKDRFLENEDEYRQRNEFINHELELEHERTLLVCGLLLILAFACFAAYYLYKLRREHRETLEQNREYAELIKSLQIRDSSSLLDTDIARRFHDLSSQDAHPTAEEWQALRNEIDRQYPKLFATLQQQYAEHQPDQTMTEQERHVIGLLAIRCNPLQMSVLLVCTKSNVSNLRRRLYQKLTGHDGSGTDLDRYITEMCEE